MTRQIVKVQVVVDVEVGTWDPDCKMQQVAAQARRDALEKTEKALSNVQGVRIVKTQVLQVILMEE